MRHDGTPNLIPQSMRSKERQREIAAMGGRASQQKARAKKSTAELINIMLNSKLDKKNAEKVKQLGSELSSEELNVNALMIAGQIKAAINGNVRAFEILQEFKEKLMELNNEKNEKEDDAITKALKKIAEKL